MGVKVAVVLSGCGFLDGAEITEAVSVLVHLSRRGAAVSCFAPDKPQLHVVDHATGEESAGESRNVLAESARIARGDIKPIDQLREADFDAVIFPGGFGAAKNLSDFASAGDACAVDPDVERVIKEFHAAGKPVGLCCIAPVLAARVLGTRAGGPGVKVTIGDDPGVAGAVESMGSTHENKPVTEASVDDAQRVVTAPAYMYPSPGAHEVFDGIGEMVEQTLARVGARV